MKRKGRGFVTTLIAWLIATIPSHSIIVSWQETKVDHCTGTARGENREVENIPNADIPSGSRQQGRLSVCHVKCSVSIAD